MTLPVEIHIKSFLRHDSLENSINSIRRYYPDITIRVCDDGHLKPYRNDIILHKLPFYSGISVGRNFMAQRCKQPYFMIWDDDFIATELTKLEKLLEVMRSSRHNGIVGCKVREAGCIRKGEGHLEVTYDEVTGRTLTRYFYGANVPYEMIEGIKSIPCRMVTGGYLCSKRLFNEYNIHWRDEMKRSDHYPFFLDLPPQVKCYCVPDVMIDHYPSCEGEYKRYKSNTMYHRMVGERKVIFKTIYDEESA